MGHVYCQIDLAERRKIERFFSLGIPVERIVEKLGQHRSTVFRELKRNFHRDPERRKIRIITV